MSLNIDALREKTKEFINNLHAPDFEKWLAENKEIHEIHDFVENKTHVAQDEIQAFFEKSKDKFKDFCSKMEVEGHDTKEAFKLLVDSAIEGKELTKEQREQIGNQMKEVLKTVGFVSLVVLPGGTLFFILATVLKLNKYILPAAFLKSKPETTKV